MPSALSSREELQRALSFLANREGRIHAYERLAAAASVDLDPFSCWF